MDEFGFAVKYPFSSVAKKILSESNPQINDTIVEGGLRRIRDALHGNIRPSGATDNTQKKEELAFYAAARMILGYMRNNFLTNKFAVEEAGRMKKYLDNANDSELDKASSEFGIVTVPCNQSSLQAKEQEELLKLPVYLKYSPRSIAYRLINRKLRSGYVTIKKRERIRLVEEAVRKHIAAMPIVRNPQQNIREAAKELLSELPKRTLPSIAAKPDDHPPCINKLLEAVKKHENLNHQARWYLAVYLLSISASEEQIVSIYSNFPDYSEKITKYQVEHARKKGYSVPSCASVATYGFCIADCRIGSPVNWHDGDYRRKRTAYAEQR
jgi:DNA primase large subunit